MYPRRGMNHQILKATLCERGICWDKEIRASDGVKGCYYNVVEKDEDDEINNYEEKNNNDTDYKTLYENQKLEIEQLKQKILELENKNKVVVENKKEEKSIFEEFKDKFNEKAEKEIKPIKIVKETKKKEPKIKDVKETKKKEPKKCSIIVEPVKIKEEDENDIEGELDELFGFY